MKQLCAIFYDHYCMIGKSAINKGDRVPSSINEIL